MQQPAQFSQAIEESSRRIGRPRFHLGVLLVHGLGEQVRGETLTVQGDPLVQWLRKHIGAMGAPGDPKVDVLDVVARQASSDTIPNAHAIVRITPPVDPETGKPVQPRAFWIVAEAFWAENFRQATFLEFIGWGLSIGPWVWATHFAGIRRRIEIGEHVDKWLRPFLVPITWVIGGVLLLIAAAVSFVTTVLAVIVILVAFTRIPVVADAARSFQRTLANGFGDAFVLSRSPIRFGAMAAEVRAALQVLRTHCDAVAVIAESQGTAVAWYGLKHEMVDAPGADEPSAARGRDSKEARRKAPIGLFLTHAQGLRKLAFALTIARKPPKERARLAAFESTAFLGLAVLALLVNAPWYALAAVILALIAEVQLLLVARPIWNEAGDDISKDWMEVLESEARANAAAKPGGPRLEWLDLWASADPGPVGPLDVDADRVSSYKIRNVGSLWADHVYYWRNTTEFLPIVAACLFALGGPPMYAKGLDDPRLLVPAMRRHARVVALLPFRALVLVGVAFGVLYASRTPDFGSGLIDFVAPLDLPVVGDFLVAPPDWLVSAAGFLFVLALGILLWLLVSVTWHALLRHDEGMYFSGDRRPLWTGRWYLFGALTLPLGGVIVGLLLYAGQPTLAVAYIFVVVLMALVFLAVLSGGGKTYGSTEEQERTLQATTKIIEGRPRSSLAITVILAAIIAALPFVMAYAWPDYFLPIVATEIVALSVVLAREGIREYRLFTKRFNSLNDLLRKPPPAKPSPPAPRTQ